MTLNKYHYYILIFVVYLFEVIYVIVHLKSLVKFKIVFTLAKSRMTCL